LPLDRDHFSQSHFELKWPVSVFREELDRLLDESQERSLSSTSASRSDWHDECELLLEEAFRYGEPKQEFGRCTLFSTAFSSDEECGPGQLDWLVSLKHYTDYLPSSQVCRPYWSQRRMQTPECAKLTFRETVRHVCDLIVELEDNGYLAQAFGQHCVDSGQEIGTLGSAPVGEMYKQLGRNDLWPIAEYWESYTLNDLCDVVEFVHDHVARPMRRYYHSFSNCGMHYSVFRREVAQKLYHVRVNAIFAESSLDLMLNEHGRFEEVAADALEPFIAGARSDSLSGGSQHNELRHAIEQFRRRGTSEIEKRLAIVALAGVLEEWRDLVKASLLSKDEAVLFEIANKFNLRHRKANQQVDYDTELYFQWIFCWYVATIRLTDKILRRQLGELL